jgi:tRNA uridine 5-carboxymethylaminomethyl modification enzyme
VTKGTNEPYRMFTSRAEYRLLLREDNADFRLRDIGRGLGLVTDEVYQGFLQKKKKTEQILARLKAVKLRPGTSVSDRLKALGSAPIKNVVSLEQLLKRNEIIFDSLHLFDPELKDVDEQVALEVETRIKYEGYIQRQERQVEKLKKMEALTLPQDMNYQMVHGLTREVKEKLSKVRPVSLGQASRISGVTPAALMAIQVFLKRAGRPEMGTNP